MVLGSSCSKRGGGALDISPPTVTPNASKSIPPDDITFKIVNDLVFKQSCVGCHSTAAGDKGKVNLETYENVFKHAHQIRLEVAGATMPPNGSSQLSADLIKLVTDWIDAGALENGKQEVPTPPTPTPAPSPTPGPTPPSNAISFDEVFNKVIKTNCLQCHSKAGGEKGHINLETYAGVFENRSDIKDDMLDKSMPDKGGTPLTDAQSKLILDWLDQGAKEKPDSN